VRYTDYEAHHRPSLQTWKTGDKIVVLYTLILNFWLGDKKTECSKLNGTFPIFNPLLISSHHFNAVNRVVLMSVSELSQQECSVPLQALPNDIFNLM
jgi:hypothetical protein